MADVLCIYYSRTGYTAKLMKKIAERFGAEIAEISDGADYSGFSGYFRAMKRTFSKKELSLLPVRTEKPLSEYEKVIIGFPIWCERVCPIAKKFIENNKHNLTGKVSLVATHMSNRAYAKPISKLFSDILERVETDPGISAITVSSEVCDYDFSEEEFTELIRDL